jgi:hypothetical protein
MDAILELQKLTDDKLVYRIITKSGWTQPACRFEAFIRRNTEIDLSVMHNTANQFPTCDEIHSISISKSYGAFALPVGEVRKLVSLPNSNPTGPMLDVIYKDNARAGISVPCPQTQRADAIAVAHRLVLNITKESNEHCKD